MGDHRLPLSGHRPAPRRRHQPVHPQGWERLLIGPILAALLAVAPSSGKEAPAILHRCHERVPDPGGGDLTFEKVFREDGSVRSFSVRVHDEQPAFIRQRRPSDRTFTTLRWPGDHRIGLEGEPFGWEQGSIDVMLLPATGEASRLQPKERWRQTVVDRNRSALVHEKDGLRTLYLNVLDMSLVSDLKPVTSPIRLHMGLDSLLAWGSGVETLTVYETAVRGRRYRRDVYPNSPVGRMRIVGQYDLDVAALRRRIEQAREGARLWEAKLTDFKACTREVEHDENDIVLT